MKYEIKPSGDPRFPYAVWLGSRVIAHFANERYAQWYADECNRTKR